MSIRGDIVNDLREAAHAKTASASPMDRQKSEANVVNRLEWRAASEIVKLRNQVKTLQEEVESVWGEDRDGRED